MNKKLISLGVTACMLATGGVMPGFAGESISFSDLPDGWAKNAVIYCAQEGLMLGADGKIRPQDRLTRAEMAAIINRSLKLSEKADLSGYVDVEASAWYYDDMAKAVKAGIFEGYDHRLNPEDEITRQEVFTVLARAYRLMQSDADLSKYSDSDLVASWAKESTAAMLAAGYIQGNDNMLQPQQPITRAEFAQILYNMKEKIGGNSGSVEGSDQQGTDQNGSNTGNGSGSSGGSSSGGSGSGSSGGSNTGSGSGGSSGGSNTGSGGGSSSGGSGSSGGNSGGSVTNPDVQTASIFEAEKCEVINIEQVHYGVLSLKSGNAEDYTFTLNGAEIHPTAVNDQKTIVKFEVNPNEKAVVKAVEKSPAAGSTAKEQTLSLGSGEKEFTSIIEGEAPEKILTSGPVSYFDYFLTNYDSDGKERTEASKTTFDTVSEATQRPDTSVPALAAEKTRLGQDIVITFDASSPEAKQWQKNIYAVQKDYGGSAESRQPLSFSVSDGKIVIDADSTAIEGRNGKHSMIVKSNGFNDAKIEIELVKPAGELNLHGDFNWWAYDDLLFVLSDFNYAVINPIYEVQLDGQTLEGDCEDYHVVSNVVRLENNCHEKLTPGAHTIVIKAEGFEDFVKTFTLETAPAGSKNPVWGGDESALAVSAAAGEIAKAAVSEEASAGLFADSVVATPYTRASYGIDALSSATSGGSVSGGTGDSEDGSNVGMIRANIIFDFDLIANAKILGALDMQTEYSAEILSWWDSLTKDGIIRTDGEDHLMTYTYFKNHAGMPSPSGDDDYVTYQELYTNALSDPETAANTSIFTLNRPYQVKNMLEDGLLGTNYMYSEAAAKNSPAVTAQSKYVGEDIVLDYSDTEDDEAWADSIQAIVSGGYTYLTEYTIDKTARTITIPADKNAISLGENSIAISSDSYRTATVTVNVSKRNESAYEVTADSEGNVIVSGISSDFIGSLRAVYLNGVGLFDDSQIGSGGDYEIIGNTVKMRAKLFPSDKNDQQKTLLLQADGYHDVILQFTVGQLGESGEDQLADVPEYVALSGDNLYRIGRPVEITMGTMFDTAYSSAVTGVLVNGSSVEGETDYYGNYTIPGENFAEAGSYTITIKADGYKDKVLTVQIGDEALAVPDYVNADQSEIEVGGSVKISVADYTGSDDYCDALLSAEIDGKSVSKSELGITGFFGKYFELSDLSQGEHTIVLHAEGYEDKTILVTVKAKSVPSAVKLIGSDGSVISDTSLVQESAHDVRIVVKEPWSAYDDYVDALSTVKIGDGEPMEIEDRRNSADDASGSVNGGSYSTDGTGGTAGAAQNDSGFNAATPYFATEAVSGSNNYTVLVIPVVNLTEGENEIILLADDYADKVFTVTVNGEIGGGSGSDTEEPGGDSGQTGLDAPEILGCDGPSWNEYTLRYDLIGLDSNYFASVSEIIVNGIHYTPASGQYSIGTNQYYVTEYSTTIIFKDTSVKSGTNTVVIKADGYKDVTYSFEAGN